jgi:hypothetical protein
MDGRAILAREVRMPGSLVWMLVVVALAMVTAGRSAEAQPSGGPFDMPGRVPEQNRLALAVDEGKALSLEARFVPGGMYYATVRITVTNPTGTTADRVYARASAFRLVTDRGAVFSPADDVVPLRGGASVANRCGLIYLVGSRPTTCDLVFLLPSGTSGGRLEFAPGPFDAISAPVAFRE